MTATSSMRSSREVVNLHTDIFDFLCTYHRVKRVPSKDTNPGAITPDNTLSDEQRGELINRHLYKILNEIELRIGALEVISEPIAYYDEWAFLTWTLLSILSRLQIETIESKEFLDYGGKHFNEKINSALIELVNKAQRMQPPQGVQQNDPHFERFYQAYVSTLISLHHLMNPQQINQSNGQLPHEQKWLAYSEFEAQISVLKDQITTCFQYQREFCNNHNCLLWQQMRESQVRKMTQYGYENKEFMESTMSFYSNMLYNLGVLAARLQGFYHEIRSNKIFSDEVDVVAPLLQMVNTMVEVLLSDSIICIEPSQNAILVTNNLFPIKTISLCRCVFFKDFSLQIVSEEVAQQIQQEMRHRKTFEPLVPIRPTASAALLAMKPSSGVKRNNATASAEGGNTAHKKSDVNSKEWISIPPSFDSDHQCWVATYPHLLCTTRQKDTLLDARSAAQTGKRPLFYFHVRAEMFSFSGGYAMAHSLSLPFTIATRRNQDCQVQRMMSSYTATCFWLYGTNIIDGLLIQWYDNEIEWKHFKVLFAQHFSLNAEVHRTLADDDFNILQHKIHCHECTDDDGGQQKFQNNEKNSLMVTFKNVLCPHLHYTAGKTDLRFSIWRGMLELQHLFSDQRSDVKNMWENDLLQGFMEPETVYRHLQAVESGLIMRLSFVIGCCICFSVKSANQILNLEPLDIRRLQSKSLHEYLRDILTAEKVTYVLNSNGKWIHVNEVIKMCQRTSNLDSYNILFKEVRSNAMSAEGVESEQTFRFTPMRIAVVTCKQSTANDESKHEMKQNLVSTSLLNSMQQKTNVLLTTQHDEAHHSRNDENRENEFGEHLESLINAYGKSASDVIELVQRYQNNYRHDHHGCPSQSSQQPTVSNNIQKPPQQPLQPLPLPVSPTHNQMLYMSSVSSQTSFQSSSSNSTPAYTTQQMSSCYTSPSTSETPPMMQYSSPPMLFASPTATSSPTLLAQQKPQQVTQFQRINYLQNVHTSNSQSALNTSNNGGIAGEYRHIFTSTAENGGDGTNPTSNINSISSAGNSDINFSTQFDKTRSFDASEFVPSLLNNKQRRMMLSEANSWVDQHALPGNSIHTSFAENSIPPSILSTPLNTPSSMGHHSQY